MPCTLFFLSLSPRITAPFRRDGGSRLVLRLLLAWRRRTFAESVLLGQSYFRLEGTMRDVHFLCTSDAMPCALYSLSLLESQRHYIWMVGVSIPFVGGISGRARFDSSVDSHLRTLFLALHSGKFSSMNNPNSNNHSFSIHPSPIVRAKPASLAPPSTDGKPAAVPHAHQSNVDPSEGMVTFPAPPFHKPEDAILTGLCEKDKERVALRQVSPGKVVRNRSFSAFLF